MLTLVSCMLALAHSPAFASPVQSTQRGIAEALILIAAVSVVTMTGAAYLRPSGRTLADLTRETDAVVAQVPDGGTLCIVSSDPRKAFLYSSVFHPQRHYRTKALLPGEQSDCSTSLRPDP